MLNEDFLKMLDQKSVIREIFDYGKKRALEIGYENVFDYSLGNPSVEAPMEFNDKLCELSKIPGIHGYSQSLGIVEVRRRVAESLKNRFNIPYEEKHIFMATGAAGALAHAMRAVTKPNDKILTFAPYFPEYIQYVTRTGCKLEIVPANLSNFQINFSELERMLDENVMAILINTPNNPTGAIYEEDTIIRLSKLLNEKQKEYGHEIYIISDEPYREIVFDGIKIPYIANYYDNTITCYSFSKSLSLPGERIGYVAVNPKAYGADYIAAMCAQISRGIGHNCPPSIIQYAICDFLDKTSDLSVYEKNMNILYDELTKLGFEIIRPAGTFYMFPKCLEEDSIKFCNKAKEFDLLLVPSDSFGVKGYFRIAYCIDTEKVIRSLDAFRRLAEYYKNIND